MKTSYDGFQNVHYLPRFRPTPQFVGLQHGRAGPSIQARSCCWSCLARGQSSSYWALVGTERCPIFEDCLEHLSTWSLDYLVFPWIIFLSLIPTKISNSTTNTHAYSSSYHYISMTAPAQCQPTTASSCHLLPSISRTNFCFRYGLVDHEGWGYHG